MVGRQFGGRKRETAKATAGASLPGGKCSGSLSRGETEEVIEVEYKVRYLKFSTRQTGVCLGCSCS